NGLLDHGFLEQVALCVGSAKRFHGVQLLVGLDSLNNDLGSDPVGQGADGPHDCLLVGVADDVLGDGDVDLENVNDPCGTEVKEIQTATEIVQRNERPTTP